VAAIIDAAERNNAAHPRSEHGITPATLLDEPDQPDPTGKALGYDDAHYLAWFKLDGIQDVILPETELQRSSYVRIDEFFETKKSIFDAFYDKQVASFAELRKQRQLAVPTAAFIKGFDQPAPRLELAVIDLAEIQHLPLDHLATGAALVLDDIPVAMFFAVFEASIVLQEHDADDVG
jgi:hypothetical protein